jgi:hypothetical protein
MATTTHPSKAQLQGYLAQRHESKLPPPTPEQIKRELGWHMLANNRK